MLEFVAERQRQRGGRSDRDLARLETEPVTGMRSDDHPGRARRRATGIRVRSTGSQEHRQRDAPRRSREPMDQRMSTHAVYVLRSSFDLWMLTARPPANSSSRVAGTTVVETPLRTFSSGNFGCGVELVAGAGMDVRWHVRVAGWIDRDVDPRAATDFGEGRRVPVTPEPFRVSRRDRPGRNGGRRLTGQQDGCHQRQQGDGPGQDAAGRRRVDRDDGHARYLGCG